MATSSAQSMPCTLNGRAGRFVFSAEAVCVMGQQTSS
jgi:hypothetical protein